MCHQIDDYNIERCAELEVAGSNPGRVKSTGLKITQENVLPLLWHLKMIRHSV